MGSSGSGLEPAARLSWRNLAGAKFRLQFGNGKGREFHARYSMTFGTMKSWFAVRAPDPR